MKRFAVAILVVAGVILAPLRTVVAAGTSAGPLQAACAESFDPNTASADLLAVCGVSTYPVVSITSLPDGGAAYHYVAGGMPVVISQPPSGFDAAAATPEERGLYGLPPEPDKADLAAHANWLDLISHVTFAPAPPALHDVPGVSFASSSQNWGGYFATGSTNSTFTVAAGSFIEPTPNLPDPCAPTAVGTWAGLGSVSTGTLAQNGTSIGVPGLNPDQGWWEILPLQPFAVNIYATENKKFEVTTTRNANGSFNFFFWNTYTDVSQSVNVTTSTYSGKNADFIFERPKINGVYRNIPDLLYNPINFTGSPNYNHLSSYSNTALDLYKGSTRLMWVSGIGGDGVSFSMHEQQCG